MTTSSGRDVSLAFIGGFLSAALIVLTVGVVAARRIDVYGLGHWKLNAKIPLTTMWMNLGYWTNADGDAIYDFEEACKTLLREIVTAAGLLHDGAASGPACRRSLAVLDVGFGCGDQTWELARLTRPGDRSDFRYVGLTANRDQMQAASRKMDREIAGMGLASDSFKLYHANAALPGAWASPIRQAVESLGDEKFSERWLLGLDCLYHFSPSRKPLLTYAARHLAANFMAFDLLLADEASLGNTLVARAAGVVLGCPVRTFLTEKEYRNQLVESGYDSDSIVIRDVSQHTYPGLVRFLIAQDLALGEHGMSLGGYKYAASLYSWVHRTKVVKACIVVARTK